MSFALLTLLLSLGTAAANGATPPSTLTPVPEFAPVAAVLMSEDLFNYSYGSAAMTDAIVAAGAEPWVVSSVEHPGVNFAARVRMITAPHSNIWLRDFGPLALASQDGELQLASFRYDSSFKDDNQFTAAIAKQLHVTSRKIDLPLDGGDFLTDGENCLTSFAASPPEKAAGASDSLLLRQMGCKRVFTVRYPPHPHVDMWAKFVAPGVLMVNELDALTLKAAEEFYGAVHPDVTDLKASLDRQADELAKYFKVVRLPMPLPYRGTFRTYSNAVLVNGTAIVPRYKRLGWDYDDYPDAKDNLRYENAVQSTYAKLGFKTKFLDADGLIFNGGAFHCVMVPLPAHVKGR